MGWVSERGASSVLANVLLVAIVVILAVTLVVLSAAFLDDTGTPTAEAAFEFQQTPAGVEIVPTALGQPVTVKLNGRSIATLDSGDAGVPTLLPTAPGDEITVVSTDGERSLLLRRTVDERDEVGDFIAYYTFESGSGSTVVDRSRNDNDGTLETDGSEGPTWNSEGSLSFDGTDDYVTIDDITTAGVDSVGSFTVAATLSFEGETGDVQQVVEHRGADGNEWFLETEATNTPFDLSYAVNFPDEVLSSARTVSVDEEVVVVGTYDGDSDEYRLYLDGEEVASDTFDRPVEMGTLRLGRDFESSNQYLDGRLSEFRLYYTAFDSSEVASITEAMR